MAHFLYMTRHCHYTEGYIAEFEPDSDETDSFLSYTDSESEFGKEALPPTVHMCDDMEVEGGNVEGDDMAVGIFPAEEMEEEEEVNRPARCVRNIVESDDDGDIDAEVTPAQPPGTMVVFDELAPGGAINPCEFHTISLFCSRMPSVWNCHGFISIVACSHA